MSKLKAEALKKYHDVQDIWELAQKSPLKYIASEDLWLDMIKHWSTPEQRAKSAQGVAARVAARLSTGGRDGKISKSGCGRVSVVDRVLREVEKTGVAPPVHKILSEINRKKDKSGNPSQDPSILLLSSLLYVFLFRYCKL